jgi:hypothetical protein
MGAIGRHDPVLLILAAFSRHDAALDWARETASDRWGDIELVSERFAFDQTSYYEESMGSGLSKQFFAFRPLVDPSGLVDWKHAAIAWEDEYRRQAGHSEPRPLNLDPGYLTQAKLVLASTKDRDHRLYLSRGIYAEGTLYYHAGAWTARPWTYPDYRQAEYHRFFDRCREYLRRQLRAEGPETASHS